MSDSLTIALNVNNNAPSQYINMPFNSVVGFDGKAVFFGPDGVYKEGGDDDAGTEIDAWIDTPNHDFGNRDQKSIEAYDVGLEACGDMEITLYGAENEDTARTFTLGLVRDGLVQQDHMSTLKKYRYGKARYWKVRIANTRGCDFSIDALSLAVVRYKRRSR